MSATTKPVLYKAEPHHGVIPRLTPDAAEAYRLSWALYLKHGSWETAAKNDPEARKLDARVAAGTLTFTAHYHDGHPMYRVVHTGGTELLDYLQQICSIKPLDLPFGVPFSSGDLMSYQEFLDKGYGPHFETITNILQQTEKAAQQEVIDRYPQLLPV